MKKFSLIIALILVCTVLFASCSKNPDNDVTTTDSSTETTIESTQAVSETLSPEEQKLVDEQIASVEKVIYNLAMAKTRDEVKPCVIQYNDEYADYVLEGFPDDDYIVKAKKLIEYKDTYAFHVTVTCECDPEYIYSGIQLFSYTEDGQLLINLDEEIEDAFVEDFFCLDCDGLGFTIEPAKTSGGYDEEITCEKCDGIGFVFDTKKVTE